jgi:LCP family protein required for cell wall assembly
MFKKDHKFKTARQDKRGAVYRFLGAFLAFALVFGSISVAMIIKNNDFSLEDIFSHKSTTAAQDGEEVSTSTVDLDKELTGKLNTLLYCVDETSSEFYFMMIVDADMDERTFKVYPINPDNPEYLSSLSTGGSKSLVSAVEKTEGIKIDKYVASDTNTFALAINYMGGLEYTVDERIEYRTDDYTLILTKGDQTIKGETLLKYFRYCKTLEKSVGMKQQGELICEMIDDYITAENVSKGSTIFQKVLSKLNSASDISYVEASRAMPTLRLLCESDERKPATVILSSQSLAQ